MYLYYWLGTNLERVWGAFRFNVYFLMGILGHFLAALVGYLVFGQVWFLTTSYLNFSLFFAFAAKMCIRDRARTSPESRPRCRPWA